MPRKTNLHGLTDETILRVYEEQKTKADAARVLGIKATTYTSMLAAAMKRAGMDPRRPLVGGKVKELKTRVVSPPRSGVKRFILTSAQNNTHVNVGVWNNLMALADHYHAEVLVSRFTYNKSAWGWWSVKPGRGPTSEDRADPWYDPLIQEYVCDDRVQLAPGLVFCGEMNILPTAQRPLQGFETYTGRQSGIFPHAKMALESVPSGKFEGTKINYTTGTVTLRNYVQKRAGLRAEFHHCYGGLLVEVDSDGRWFVRQLNADESDAIYDLDLCAQGGVVTAGHRVEAITWGDVHVDMLDPVVADLAWMADGNMLDQLQPKYQFMHDLVDFRSRNHHDRGNPHRGFQRWVEGHYSVEDELTRVVGFLGMADREWCETVVVDSNHDNAMERWLREADYRTDPQNAELFLEAQREKYRAIRTGDSDFHLIEWSLRHQGCDPRVRFLREDESFIVCRDRSGGIECGIHGHLGPNGQRGTPRNLSRMGRKANTGHTHAAQIIDGMYVAGASAKLDMEFNRGPSSWSHSHIITYANGKRAIVTMWKGKWRAA